MRFFFFSQLLHMMVLQIVQPPYSVRDQYPLPVFSLLSPLLTISLLLFQPSPIIPSPTKPMTQVLDFCYGSTFLEPIFKISDLLLNFLP